MVRLITAPVGAQSTGSRYCLGSKPFEGCLLLVRIPIETAPALTTVNPVPASLTGEPGVGPVHMGQ
ncbi:MAG: hypothetical protein ACYC38_06325 [Eubacteriales bacterium]